MPLKSITIEVAESRDTGFVSDVLFELGALSVSISDLHQGTAAEDPIYGQPPQDTVSLSTAIGQSVWRNARITALFPLSVDSEALLMTIGTEFGLEQTPTMRIYSEVFEDKSPAEWVAQVQSSFQPICLGKLTITFPWHPREAGVANVVLEPGMTFGTGEHATTQLCARWVIENVRKGMEVLDFGTGSGVLAIVAAVMEDVRAVGVDLDADALQVARANAERNGVADRVSIYENKDEPEGREYDLVVANIMAGPLKSLADRLVSRLKPGGMIGVSGVLVGQAEEMRAWYGERGIWIENAAVDCEWVLLVGRKMGKR